MKNKIFLIFILFTGVQIFAYGQKKNIRVLFVGNSLTYQNNVPDLVTKLADCDGVQMTYHTLAFPDYALEDHWNDGVAAKEISSDTYNFVVVQQGPSSQTEGYTLLKDYGIKFSQLCGQHHAQLVFYMVWPSKARSMDFPGVYRSYKRVAEETKSIFSPAGQAWLTLWKSSPEFSLYGADNFHPNDRGSLLAALVLYGSISGRNDFDYVALSKLGINKLTVPELNLLMNAAGQTLKDERK